MSIRLPCVFAFFIATTFAHAADYYLQRNSNVNTTKWASSGEWYDDPTLGMGSTLTGSFDGHNFYLNDHVLRSDTSNSFMGASLVLDSDADIIDVFGDGTHTITNRLDFDRGTIRLHSSQTNIATFDIDTLDVGGHINNFRKIRANGVSKELTVNVANLTGDTSLVFGNPNMTSTEEGNFKFGAMDTTGFIGELRVMAYSELTLTSSNFDQAGLNFSTHKHDGSEALHRINLSGNVYFDRLIVNGSEDGTLVDGNNYTVGQLNSKYDTVVFTGTGTLHIGSFVPEPSSYALIIGAGLLMVKLVSRRGLV